MEKYGFIYIWRDRKHKRYYIGMHWGTEDDGYICSSPWMLKSFARRPQDFKRKILERVYTTRKELYERELYWLSMIKDEELKKRYYNLNKTVNDTWLNEENKLSRIEKISKATKEAIHRPEVREKYLEGLKKRKSLKGLPGRQWTNEQKIAKSKEMLGKNRSGDPKNWKHNDKTKEIIRIKNKGKISPMKGKKHSAIACVLMSEAKKGNKNRLGKYHPDEIKQKISRNRKGYVWYNNGKEDILIKGDNNIPQKYFKGRITKFKEKGKWYYNPETLEKRQCVLQPKGWLPGMRPNINNN